MRSARSLAVAVLAVLAGACSGGTLDAGHNRRLLDGLVGHWRMDDGTGSTMNTSDAVAEALGAHVRKVCDDAIRNAVRDGRKTVLDRDVPPAFVR